MQRLNYALHSSAKTIIIGAALTQYNSNNEGEKSFFSYSYNDIPMGNLNAFSLGLKETVYKFVSAGKTVILMGDNPSFNIQRESDANYSRIDCSIARESAKQQQLLMKTLLDLAEKYPQSVKIFDPLDSLCDSKVCPIWSSGVALYRDKNHLSRDGSLVKMKSFFEKIQIR